MNAFITLDDLHRAAGVLRERAVVLLRLLLHLAGVGYRRFVAWLDEDVFKAVVAYATHPIIIFATILLLIPLIVFANITSLALTMGNYLNVCSAAVSSIVLMQSLKHHHENKRLHAQHAEEIAALHAKIDALSPTSSLSPPTRPRRAARPLRTTVRTDTTQPAPGDTTR